MATSQEEDATHNAECQQGFTCFNFGEWDGDIDAISTTAPAGGFPKDSLNKVAPIGLKDEILVIILFLTVFGSFFYVPLGIVAAFIFLPLKYAVAALCLVVALAVHPIRFWPELCHSHIVTIFMRYCSYRTVWPRSVDPVTMGAVFGLVPPHGVFPLQNLLTHFSIPKCTGKPCNYVRGMAADALLHVPVIRHFVTWMGAVPASKPQALKMLSEGFISGVSPDGIAGIFEVNDPNEVLVIAKRRGIYEIAIKSGKPIMCSYTFGTTKAFEASWGGPGSPLVSLSRMLRTSLFVFWGRFCLPIPKRVAITTVWARPITCVQSDTPAAEEIDRMQELTIKTYRKMFDLHKVAYGWGEKALIIK